MRQSTKIKAKGTDLTWSQICSSILYFHVIYTQISARIGGILNIMDLSFLIFSTCNQEAVTQFTGPGGATPGWQQEVIWDKGHG